MLASHIEPLLTDELRPGDIVGVILDDLVRLGREGIRSGVSEDAEANAGDLVLVGVVAKIDPSVCMMTLE